MPVSAALQSRELNGEVLLEELAELRAGQVSHAALFELASQSRALSSMRLSDAVVQLKAIAQKLASQPALSALALRWAGKLKSDLDVPLLVAHFERLALDAAVLGALRKASERLPKGGRG